MSIFNWFSRKAPAPQDSTFHLDEEEKRPARSTESAADAKRLRKEHREQLYDVVRDAILQSRVLAANFRFKVLSLDASGRQSLVMVDLADEVDTQPQRLTAIEDLIVTKAAKSCGLAIKGVYWRITPAAGEVRAAAAAPSPVPVPAPVSAPVAATPTTPREPAKPTSFADSAPSGSVFEQIGQDEMLAFKKAIIEGGEKPAAPARKATATPKKASGNPDFAATQFLEEDEAASPLSKTQFGKLD